jgi:hypothetical protein
VEVKVADLDDIRAQAAPHQREDLAGDVVGLIATPWAFKHLTFLSVVHRVPRRMARLSDPVTMLTTAGRPILAGAMVPDWRGAGADRRLPVRTP